MIGLPLTRLLHENMATVITFVFSYGPIKRLIDGRVIGSIWKISRLRCLVVMLPVRA
jgi:hypothetical protein